MSGKLDIVCYVYIMMLTCLECRMLVIRMFGILIGNRSYTVLLLNLSASAA